MKSHKFFFTCIVLVSWFLTFTVHWCLEINIAGWASADVPPMQVADSPLTLETPDFRARRGYSQHTPPPPPKKKHTQKSRLHYTSWKTHHSFSYWWFVYFIFLYFEMASLRWHHWFWRGPKLDLGQPPDVTTRIPTFNLLDFFSPKKKSVTVRDQVDSCWSKYNSQNSYKVGSRIQL